MLGLVFVLNQGYITRCFLKLTLSSQSLSAQWGYVSQTNQKLSLRFVFLYALTMNFICLMIFVFLIK